MIIRGLWHLVFSQSYFCVRIPPDTHTNTQTVTIRSKEDRGAPRGASGGYLPSAAVWVSWAMAVVEAEGVLAVLDNL